MGDTHIETDLTDRLPSGPTTELATLPEMTEFWVTETLSVAKLTTLSHSNHTLSPYTRTLEHFTVRSVPPRDASTSGPASSVERQPVKARRKRLHRLRSSNKGKGKSRQAEPMVDEDVIEESAPSSPGSPAPPSEFDASEMDRYFRSRDELIPRYPNLHPSHVRRRVPHPT